MASMTTTCPLTGLCYTITDDYTVARCANQPHFSYHDLPTIITRERWKAPASYLVAAIFYQLNQKNLIIATNQEPSTARATINVTLARSIPAARLYSLYTKLRDSKAPLALDPIRINLTTLLDLTASQIYERLRIVATQSLKDADREAIWEQSTSRASRTETLTKHKPPKHSGPRHITERLAKETPKLYRLLIESTSLSTIGHTLPSYLIPSSDTDTAPQRLVSRICKVIPDYDQLSARKQQDLLTILAAIYNVAFQNSLVSHYDPLGTAYHWYTDKAKKNLLKSNTIFDII